jgi:hypothetical protein
LSESFIPKGSAKKIGVYKGDDQNTSSTLAVGGVNTVTTNHYDHNGSLTCRGARQNADPRKFKSAEKTRPW